MNDIVQIIGRGKTRKYVQYSPSKDVWAFNDNAMTIPINRLSAVFEMHDDWSTRYEGITGCETYVPFLRQQHAFPIWMHTPSTEIPSSRRYPLIAMPRQFFQGTPAYAIALAIYLGYRQIELFGIEADRGTEYEASRDSLFYWMGRAEGAGILLLLHQENKLFDAPLYPPTE